MCVYINIHIYIYIYDGYLYSVQVLTTLLSYAPENEHDENAKQVSESRSLSMDLGLFP